MKNKAFVVLKRYFDTPKKERTEKIKNSFDHIINNKKGMFDEDFKKIHFTLRGEKIERWSNGKRKNNENKRRSD